MTIKFIPSNQDVRVLDREPIDREVINLLKCVLNGLHRVEKQLEKVTDEEIDSDDGRLI